MSIDTARAAALPADQDQRDRITTDTGATLFVNAGAGSGKTRALVDRISTLVLHEGIPMLHIAAVTFTEKAGAELRDRLRATFEGVWRDERPANAERRELAARALDELDRAAVGTLHSFAQRILTEHAVAAGLPPLVEVLDEVASSIAFEDRWASLRTELLDDDDMADAVLLGMATGVTLDHVRSIAKSLGSDWDLIEDRVLSTRRPAVGVPDLGDFWRHSQTVMALADECQDPGDKLLERFGLMRQRLAQLREASDDSARLAALQQVAGVRFSYGRKGNWARDVAEVRNLGNGLAAAAGDLLADLRDRCLRAITHWTAERVVTAAVERRREGQLEFHDLLVLARDLLRRDAEVRTAVHHSYQRLLLDEFQDTDPIQIELAVRIAGGADADAPDWAEVRVEPGRLFFVGDAKQSIYRFRRADIGMYLRAQQRLGEQVSLTTNFRTTAPILAWVNEVFSQVIQAEEGSQPAYEPLVPYRHESAAGPAVTTLGTHAHQERLTAPQLRALEAADVARAITTMVDQGWQIQDRTSGHWRAVRHADIAVLVPARTSLPFLEEALTAAGLPYRAEASSLVYQADEVRALLATARAIADPSDQLSLVAALRSPLFGCGDDDLWNWKHHGGALSLWAPTDAVAEPVRQSSPVTAGLESLRSIARLARWATPSEVLEEIIARRRMFEVAAGGRDQRDVWRRLRFVVDQARAWSQVTRGGLRAYLAWAAHQGEDASRASESVLPETDVDAVHISTIHAAKGLEYPVVVLSGMSGRPAGHRGVQVLWPADGGYAVRLTKDLQTADFAAAQPLDEQMGDAERRRLLYVAATRARDHLVVSLHRTDSTSQTPARILADAGAATSSTITPLEHLPVPSGAARRQPPSEAAPLPDAQNWTARTASARQSAERDEAMVASGLEGTEPSVVLAEVAEDAGLHKGPRDLVLPPWSKGRYGSAVGRAVHGVLQSVDLALREPPAAQVQAQCVAEGVTEHQDLVTALVRSALQSPLVAGATNGRYWRESYVGTVQPDGTVLEGYVDLIIEADDGTLVIVDYKTDAVPAAALDARVAYYQPQMQAYATCLGAATGKPVRCELLFLHPRTAVQRSVPVA